MYLSWDELVARGCFVAADAADKFDMRCMVKANLHQLHHQVQHWFLCVSLGT